MYIYCSVTSFLISLGWKSRRPGPNGWRFSPTSQAWWYSDTVFWKHCYDLTRLCDTGVRTMRDKTNSGAAFEWSYAPHVEQTSVLWRNVPILWKKDCHNRSRPLDMKLSRFNESQILPTCFCNVYFNDVLPSHSQVSKICVFQGTSIRKFCVHCLCTLAVWTIYGSMYEAIDSLFSRLAMVLHDHGKQQHGSMSNVM